MQALHILLHIQATCTYVCVHGRGWCECQAVFSKDINGKISTEVSYESL